MTDSTAVEPPKRKAGRPPGAKNKPKAVETEATPGAPVGGELSDAVMVPQEPSIIDDVRAAGGMVNVTKPAGGIPMRDQFKKRNIPAAYRMGKIIMWPAWTGYLKRFDLGKPTERVEPEIRWCACGPNHNGGAGIEYYLRNKKFKPISALPDEYAHIRDKLMPAMQELVAKEQSRIRRIRELVELGMADAKRAQVDQSHYTILNGQAF